MSSSMGINGGTGMLRTCGSELVSEGVECSVKLKMSFFRDII